MYWKHNSEDHIWIYIILVLSYVKSANQQPAFGGDVLYKQGDN